MRKGSLPYDWLKDIGNSRDFVSLNNDFILIDDMSLTASPGKPFKLDMVVAVICLNGYSKGYINMNLFITKPKSILILLPDQIIQHESISEDFEGLCIIMSKNFIEELNLKNSVPMFLSLLNNPVLPLDEQSYKALNQYFYLVRRTVQMSEHPYRTEVVKHLTLALFYGLGPMYHKPLDKDSLTKNQELAGRFLELVNENFKQERSAKFYAGKLCITPKYMSKLVKEASGKSAIDWINDAVILEAKALLRSSTLTIKEITYELNFPSQSFFGKYFKRHTGFTPSEYRES